MRKKSVFITFEGIEGMGKSTVTHAVEKYLDEKNIPYIVTREPGGTPLAESIRRVVLGHHDEKVCEAAELMLMFASRAQHIEEKIKPALAAGKWVLCDRFTDSSFAYQGGGRKLSMERIAQLESWVQGDLQPNLTLLLDGPVELGLHRIKKRTKDRIEKEDHDFFNRIRATYLDRAKQFPDRFVILDANKTRTEVKEAAIKAVNILCMNGRQNDTLES